MPVLLMLILSFTASVQAADQYSAFPCRLPYAKGPKMGRNNIGYCLNPDVCPGAAFGTPCGRSYRKCCLLEDKQPDVVPISRISLHQAAEVFGRVPRTRALYGFLRSAIYYANLTSCHQLATFISQVAADTEFLRDMEQRLGKDDITTEELRFVGRGALQIPGEAFYRWISKTLGQDFIAEPDLLTFPSKAFTAAALIWKHGFTSLRNTTVDYNSLCDGTPFMFSIVTYYLKGSLDDLDHRLDVYHNVSKIFGCKCIEKNTVYKCRSNEKEGTCAFKETCRGHLEPSDQCPGPKGAVGCCIECPNTPKAILVVAFRGNVTEQQQKVKVLLTVLEGLVPRTELTLVLIGQPWIIPSSDILDSLQNVSDTVASKIFDTFNLTALDSLVQNRTQFSSFHLGLFFGATDVTYAISDEQRLIKAIDLASKYGTYILIRPVLSEVRKVIVQDGGLPAKAVELDEFGISQLQQFICLAPLQMESGKRVVLKVRHDKPRYVKVPYQGRGVIRIRTLSGHLTATVLSKEDLIPGRNRRHCLYEAPIQGSNVRLVIPQGSLQISPQARIFAGHFYLKIVAHKRDSIVEICISSKVKDHPKVEFHQFLVAAYVVLVVGCVLSLVAALGLCSRVSNTTTNSRYSCQHLSVNTADRKRHSHLDSPTFRTNGGLANFSHKHSLLQRLACTKLEEESKNGNSRVIILSDGKYYSGLKMTKIFSLLLYCCVVISSADSSTVQGFCWLLCGLFSFSSVAFFSLSLTEIWALYTMVQMAQPTRTHKLLLITLAFALPTIVSISSCWAKTSQPYLCWNVINSGLHWIMVVCNSCLFLINLALVYLLKGRLERRELVDDRKICQKNFICWDFSLIVVFSVAWILTLLVMAYPSIHALQVTTACVVLSTAVVLVVGNCLVTSEYNALGIFWRCIRSSFNRKYVGREKIGKTAYQGSKSPHGDFLMVTDGQSGAFGKATRKDHRIITSESYDGTKPKKTHFWNEKIDGESFRTPTLLHDSSNGVVAYR